MENCGTGTHCCNFESGNCAKLNDTEWPSRPVMTCYSEALLQNNLAAYAQRGVVPADWNEYVRKAAENGSLITVPCSTQCVATCRDDVALSFAGTCAHPHPAYPRAHCPYTLCTPMFLQRIRVSRT